MDTHDATDAQLAARARVEALARIAYGRALIASGLEMLELVEILTPPGEPVTLSEREILAQLDAAPGGARDFRRVGDSDADHATIQRWLKDLRALQGRRYVKNVSPMTDYGSSRLDAILVVHAEITDSGRKALAASRST